EERTRMLRQPARLIGGRQAECTPPDGPPRHKAGRPCTTRGLELHRELARLDVAAAEQHPLERGRSGGEPLAAGAIAGVLELEHVRARVGELLGARDDEVGECSAVGGLALALEAVGERLEDEREPVPVAVLGRSCDELALPLRARVVVGAVVDEELAAVRPDGERVFRAELEFCHPPSVDRRVALLLERHEGAEAVRPSPCRLVVEQRTGRDGGDRLDDARLRLGHGLALTSSMPTRAKAFRIASRWSSASTQTTPAGLAIRRSAPFRPVSGGTLTTRTA